MYTLDAFLASLTLILERRSCVGIKGVGRITEVNTKISKNIN